MPRMCPTSPIRSDAFDHCEGNIGISVRQQVRLGFSSTPMLTELGMVAALVAGIAAICLFVRLLQSSGFHYFAYYTWLVGVVVLIGFGVM